MTRRKVSEDFLVLRCMILIGIMFLGSAMPGCDEIQTGKILVKSRETISIENSGRIDVLFGISNVPSEDVPKPVAAFVLLSNEKIEASFTVSGGDGRIVSALNVYLHESNKSSFGYGAAWNRENGTIVVDGTQFKREEGCIFLILRMNGLKQVVQLKAERQVSDVPELIAEIVAITENREPLKFVAEALRR